MGNPFKKVPWKNVFNLTKAIVETMVPEIAIAEGVVREVADLKNKSGADKQAAVLDAVKQSVVVAEGLSDRDLLNDPEVEKATKGTIDAVVALQNVLVKKSQAAAPAAN
jgi:predicted polyphosphate/ATP-dependent NAD kinase